MGLEGAKTTMVQQETSRQHLMDQSSNSILRHRRSRSLHAGIVQVNKYSSF